MFVLPIVRSCNFAMIPLIDRIRYKFFLSNIFVDVKWHLAPLCCALKKYVARKCTGTKRAYIFTKFLTILYNVWFGPKTVRRSSINRSFRYLICRLFWSPLTNLKRYWGPLLYCITRSGRRNGHLENEIRYRLGRDNLQVVADFWRNSKLIACQLLKS